MFGQGIKDLSMTKIRCIYQLQMPNSFNLFRLDIKHNQMSWPIVIYTDLICITKNTFMDDHIFFDLIGRHSKDTVVPISYIVGL